MLRLPCVLAHHGYHNLLKSLNSFRASLLGSYTEIPKQRSIGSPSSTSSKTRKLWTLNPRLAEAPAPAPPPPAPSPPPEARDDGQGAQVAASAGPANGSDDDGMPAVPALLAADAPRRRGRPRGSKDSYQRIRRPALPAAEPGA